jgi:hypothetical protein
VNREFVAEKLEERDYFGDLDVEGDIIEARF